MGMPIDPNDDSGERLREGFRKAFTFAEGATVRITNGTTGEVSTAVVQPHGSLTPTARREDGSVVILGMIMADFPALWGQSTVESV